MKFIVNRYSFFKKNFGNKLSKLKTQSQKFNEKFKQTKSEPKSKRKSFFLGLSTVIFITIISPVLPALAENVSPSGQSYSSPPVNQSDITSNKQVVKGVTSAYTQVINNVSMLLGAVCGMAIGYTLLRVQGK